MLHGFATSQLKDTLLAEPTAPPLSEPAGDGRGSTADEAAGGSVDHPYPHLHRRLHDTQVAVGTFISGTLLYVLSRQWQDLLAVNVFHLHPLPFCDTAHGNLSQLPCTPEAGSGVQFLFAAGMLCVAAVVQHVSLRNEARWPSLTIVPRMVGMCVGWAFGFAALQALSEMEAWPMFSHVSSWVLGAAVSACATLLSALIILAGQPSTLCVGCAAEQLEELWPMCSHVCHALLEPQTSRQGPRQLCYSHVRASPWAGALRHGNDAVDGGAQGGARRRRACGAAAGPALPAHAPPLRHDAHRVSLMCSNPTPSLH